MGWFLKTEEGLTRGRRLGKDISGEGAEAKGAWVKLLGCLLLRVGYGRQVWAWDEILQV